MRKRIAAAVIALLLAVQLFLPALPAAGYFPEDGFEKCWIIKKIRGQNETEDKRPLYYEVCPGDTLWGLARRWGLEPGAIAAANGLRDDGVLYPGQRLVIPLAEGFVHRLVPGDTLWSLARRYHVSVERLASVNRIVDPAALTVGRELIIPGGVAAIARTSGERTWTARGLGSSLVWPLVGEITSFFGIRGGEFHHGIDIAGYYGDPIRAAERGRVAFVGEMPCYGYTVILDHGLGEQTLYAHIQESLVKAGDFVGKGEIIARVGSTGRATGPHLHFEVRLNSRAVDPLPYLRR